MSKQDLVVRLYRVACESLALANNNTLFVANKKQAMKDINTARKLLTATHNPV